MASDRALAVFEFALWVLAATAIVVAVVLPLGLLIGGDFVAAKFALFLVGMAIFGVGSLAIQPEGPDLEGSIYDPAERSGDGEDGGGRRSGHLSSSLSLLGSMAGRPEQSESGVVAADNRDAPSGFDERIRNVGPLADHHLPPERRIGRRYRIFATGIAVLTASFLLEVAGVGV